MSLLKVTAQNCMDAFYQQFKSEEDFFELYHFKYLLSVMYFSYLQKEYEQSYKQTFIETGTGMATINPEWYMPQEITITPSDKIAAYVGELQCKPFQFRFDNQSTGIRDIVPIAGRCKEFIRINFDERYKFELLPPSSEVYWFPLGNQIYFNHIKCGLSKAIVLIIPDIDPNDENAVIPAAIEADVLSATLNFMLQARQGKQVIDVSQDGNPNMSLQTEINNLFTKMQGK